MNRRPTARTTPLLFAAALCAVGLTGCASGSTSSASSASPSSPAATTASADATPSVAATTTTTPPPTPTPTPTAEGQLVEITVANGKVTGPKGRVKVKAGSTVTLRVTSDVADEIHLHGYDKYADVDKGGTADLTFKATLTGVFEAELEKKGLQLTQLQVQ